MIRSVYNDFVKDTSFLFQLNHGDNDGLLIRGKINERVNSIALKYLANAFLLVGTTAIVFLCKSSYHSKYFVGFLGCHDDHSMS
jgi:hypothetical protein